MTVPNWSDLVFLVSSASAQRRILTALSHINRPGVTASEAASENRYYVILDCERLADEVHAQHVVMVFDRHAVRTCSSQDGLAPAPIGHPRNAVAPSRLEDHR